MAASSPHTPSARVGGSPAVGGINGHGTPRVGAGRTATGGTTARPLSSLGHMERMILHNFKSYDGEHSVPFVNFTAGQIRRQREGRKRPRRAAKRGKATAREN